MFEFLFKYPVELYRKGSVAFSGPFQLELRLLVAILLAALIVWLYRRMPSHVGRARLWAIIACRVAAVAALVFVLFPPVLVTRDVRVQDRFVALLIDDSRSMTIADDSDNSTRLDQARRFVFGAGGSSAESAGLASRLSGLCGVRAFRFAGDVQRLSSPDELQGRGYATDVFTALKGVDEKLRGVPLAAVVLLSDGNHNTAGDPMSAARLMAAKRAPIFAVGLGSPTPPRDYEIFAVSAPRRVRRKSSVDVVVSVRSQGYADPYVVVLRRGPEMLGQSRVTPRSTSDVQQVTIPVFLEREGTSTFTLEIPPGAGERITANNRREFQVDVEETRLPVLYIEGSPRPEFRFLRGALFEDEDFRIVSILRLGQGRFLVQGSDDPALAKGYPTTEEQLFAYEAIIFGDIEASFFTKQQLELTERFVSERGGGFLMLGGVNSFNLGGYRGTPIDKLLPLRLAADATPYDPRQIKIQVVPTSRDATHPIMHQVTDPVANRNVWNTVSPLMGHNPVGALKPGATALMETVPGAEPVLAVQDYGIGRAAAFTTGGSWFWRMNRPSGDALHPRFWKQLIRWLAMGSKPKLSVDVKTTVALGEPVTLGATVLGKSLEPVNDAAVSARIENPFGQAEDVPLEWILSRDGVYEGAYAPRETGEHKLTVTARYEGATEPLKIETTFIVGDSTVEFSPGWQNATFLRSLAERTGGEYFTPADGAALAQRIEQQVRRSADAEADVVRHDLWDMPALFLLLLVALSTEWLLRRRSGLP